MNPRLAVQTSLRPAAPAFVRADTPVTASLAALAPSEDRVWPDCDGPRVRLNRPTDRYFVDAENEIRLLERAISAHRPGRVAASAGRVMEASHAVGAAGVASIAAELSARAGAGDLSVAAHLLASLEYTLVQVSASLGARNAEPSGCTQRHHVEEVVPARVAPRVKPPPTTPNTTKRGSWWRRLQPIRARTATIALLMPAIVFGTLAAQRLWPAATGAVVADAVVALLAVTIMWRERRRPHASDAPSPWLLPRELPDRALFEHNPQPLWVYDRETLRIVAVSNAAVATYGYSREEFLSMTIRDLRPPADQQHLMDYLETAVGKERLGFSPWHPWRHQYKNGTIIDVEVTSDDLVLGGRDCRIVLSQDVTARNQAVAELAVVRDEAVESSNLKSAFLANVSHEIRTPMNGVMGMNELLLETDLSVEQRGYAEQIAHSASQMLAVIDDVLDISKIEAGHLELDTTDFGLGDAISKACVVAGVEAEAKGLQLDIHIHWNVPRFVRGDDQRLSKIVASLVSNAVKFTPAGGVLVDVYARPPIQAASTRVRVEVADTGIGVDPMILERMFEPFTQADASTTRNHGGIGLGLAIARELVELMDGTIGARSEPGHGSTFWFEVDLELPDARARRAGPHRTPAAPVQRRQPAPLVLVAEDSRVNQIVAVRALERCGCRAAVAGDGRQALDALSTRRFDAVLMDCHMPAIDGYQATAQLRSRERPTEHTPVIAMSARAMTGDREQCLDAGMDDYITKPLHHEDLAQVLRRWIPALAGCAIAVTAEQGADAPTNTQHPHQDQALADTSRCGLAGSFLRPARWRPGLHARRSELDALSDSRSG